MSSNVERLYGVSSSTTDMHILPQPAGPQTRLPTVPYEGHRSPSVPEREQLSPLKNIWRRNSWPQPLVPLSNTHNGYKYGWEDLRAWGRQKG